MKKLKVGLVGLGQVAQIVHLPVLTALADRYEIAAMCDISPGLLEHMGRRYGIANLYASGTELARQDDLDVVFVLNANEYHAECAIAAANNGKHVFVEKPMCYTMAEAEAIIEAKNRTGVHVMVGYMRRYAPAFVRAAELVRQFERINYVTVRDIIGGNYYFTRQSGIAEASFRDVPAELALDRQQRFSAAMREVMGENTDGYDSVFGLLYGLSTHDLSAMRELVGMPKRVVSAVQWNGGGFLQAILEYDGYHASFETGMDGNGRFDGHIEVMAPTRTVKLQYDTPYLRQLPIKLTVTETEGDAYRETVERPTFVDPYLVELNHFYDVITAGAPLKTTPEDAADDVRLVGMLLEALRRNG